MSEASALRVMAVSESLRDNRVAGERSSLLEMNGGVNSGNWLIKDEALSAPRDRLPLFEVVVGKGGDVCDRLKPGDPEASDLFRLPPPGLPGVVVSNNGGEGEVEGARRGLVAGLRGDDLSERDGCNGVEDVVAGRCAWKTR